MFKIIVSPEFGERMDLEQHARDLMKRMSQELGVPLEWVAAVHRNTDHPHVHIALRGSGGLRLPKDYVRHGIRQQAEELCTAQLGYRTELDIRESERREVAAQHPTSLDRRIARLQPGEKLTPILASRLRTLQRMGLAKSSDNDTWEVRPDFLTILRAMKKATDRQKMIAAHASAISNPHLPVQYTPASQITGARRGELLALRWPDVKDGAVSITRSLCQTKSGLTFKETKTRTARIVVLPNSAIVAVEAHRQAQDSFLKQFGADYRPTSIWSLHSLTAIP